MKSKVKFRESVLSIFGIIFVLGFTSAGIEFTKIKTKLGKYRRTENAFKIEINYIILCHNSMIIILTRNF